MYDVSISLTVYQIEGKSAEESAALVREWIERAALDLPGLAVPLVTACDTKEYKEAGRA